MKTLTIALCLLLVVLPTSAQQIASPRAPSFYVSYGVRDVPPEPVEPGSSSAEMTMVDPGQRPSLPMPRRSPVRRPAHHRSRPGYGAFPSPPSLSTIGAVVGVVIAFGLIAALVGGDR